jgi:hypothetical protein
MESYGVEGTTHNFDAVGAAKKLVAFIPLERCGWGRPNRPPRRIRALGRVAFITLAVERSNIAYRRGDIGRAK